MAAAFVRIGIYEPERHKEKIRRDILTDKYVHEYSADFL